MGAKALSLNSMDFPRSERGRRKPAFEIELAPSAMSIPNTLLIDSDPLFAYAFEREARKYHVPVRTFDSILALDRDLRWDYDLVIFDIDTVGGEFLTEIADDIEASHGYVPILAIGTGQPGRVDRRNWEGSVRGFSDKTWGVDAVLSDALQAFSSCTKNLPKKSLTLIK
jgi:hypothetical protein